MSLVVSVRRLWSENLQHSTAKEITLLVTVRDL